MPFTYTLRCADDTLYVGHTEDLASREEKEALIRNDRTALDWLSHRKSKATAAFTWRDLLNHRTYRCRRLTAAMIGLLEPHAAVPTNMRFSAELSFTHARSGTTVSR